ncbi:polyamine aminopropyltransferase [Dethiobacter alkaliphilus]|uniref:Polyamine aminopropyltransferase n=1 Tax=Dethiobacter alkaliphilus AHT 1 TaxID=555088 RepID=C0GHV5_DETAL|nr:polyamine aminopropyltransferase [Dethiobacter alkaliphilus]EEG77029.1 spermidine synthase [Dethiobacter alkaliphilus AHT 1]
MTTPTWKWFIEYTHPTQAHMHGVEQFIYSGKTKYQVVEIIDTDFYGRCLVLDGKIQSSEYDEYIYHETLIHPALTLHPEPKSVMIVGGGEGAVLREILRHPSVERILMVDIDQEVVELCKEYLPEWSQGAFKNPKVEVRFMDARKYLEDTAETFDVIYMDLPEPLDDGPAYLLFTQEFYQVVSKRLTDNGVIALQAGSFNPRLLECHAAVCNTLATAFPVVCSYASFIPSYDATWGFAVAAKSLNPLAISAEEVDKRLSDRKITELKYYDGETHISMFAVPKDVRTAKNEEKRIIADDRPLITY